MKRKTKIAVIMAGYYSLTGAIGVTVSGKTILKSIEHILAGRAN